ncbi:polysaccharide biosynthesis/export family protein [Cytophagales bacterium LB-30]|uniref:Polysaccharide biosynthesis/export family protein n=1 Tax=Shiella aurantiaca TaxID=3058365 RepID=A0ABT8FA31_9BACT|nr:polysaccharide biosynthesis/export family protein [Shiella aurantiaca]MDN4166821.1 polysaccharide biosynthesis/export family protein [Shiella aurantiaca]
MKRSFLFIASLALLLAFSGCKVYRQNIMFKTKANRLPEGLSQLSQHAERNYILQPFDRITVQVYTNKGERLIDPDFELMEGINPNMMNNRQNSEYFLDENGMANIPMLGFVNLKGLRLDQADSLFQQEYQQFYNEPFVITRIASKRVTVLGGTTSQVIPFQNENMNLIEAIALAGGMPANGKAQNVRLIRGPLDNPQVFVIDLSTIEGMVSTQQPLQAGDIIYIEPVRRVLPETIRDIAPLVGLITNVITLVVVLQNLN